MGREADAKIHLAFRFHANFYHSYRGDTPDEAGFGKDIRIIRRIIEVLDSFNAEGVSARGTWDIENYFSLEKIMPEHCPDIIESLRRRVAEGKDEVQVMSYNNGLISAHTAAEFDYAIGRAISNPAGSGLRDLFDEFGSMVRPQEMMYTPLHLKLYPAHGINYISLFYSSVPFNAFSNFIPPLSFEQRYNPLTLTYPGIDQTMTLVPAQNHGDIADNISLRWWLKRLRRRQLRMSEPKDLLLLIDADADDDYWYGYGWPVISTVLAAAAGLRGLLQSVRDLDFVTFTTPAEYVKTHPPLGTIALGQDTADGSFDGLSSWAEKWSNHQLWTGVERSRVLELQTRRLLDAAGEKRKEIEDLLAESLDARMRVLSTTHFGLSSPVMNVTRLKAGADLVSASIERASRAFEHAAASFEHGGTAPEEITFTLIDYVRGVSTKTVTYYAKPSRALIRIPITSIEAVRVDAVLKGPDGKPRPFVFRKAGPADGTTAAEILFVEHMGGSEQKDFQLDFSNGPGTSAPIESPVSIGKNTLSNEFMELRFDVNWHPVGLTLSGTEFAADGFLRSAVNYSGRLAEADHWTVVEKAVLGDGLIALLRTKSEIPVSDSGNKRVEVEREFMLVAGLPYVYVDTQITYPETHSERYNKERARRLEQAYDGNWREVMPCEIRPALLGKAGWYLRVWKHNYLGHMSCYDLDYAEFSKNKQLDAFNNHITHAWVAVTDRDKGVLVGQTADVNACFAFCPMRTRTTSEGQRILLNPFGSYHGSQLHYVTAFSGLGKRISLQMADQLDPYAPSYNGRSERCRLLIAPYVGDEPPEELRNDAEAFAYPHAVVSGSKFVDTPPHRRWSAPRVQMRQER